jgi:hypothetical protein
MVSQGQPARTAVSMDMVELELLLVPVSMVSVEPPLALVVRSRVALVEMESRSKATELVRPCVSWALGRSSLILRALDTRRCIALSSSRNQAMWDYLPREWHLGLKMLPEQASRSVVS